MPPFAPLFSHRTWHHIPLLVVGAILAPGRRMVSSALRAVGLAQVSPFQTDHRVLNRAVWSSLKASRILLHLLIGAFAPDGPLVLGIDETTRAPTQPQDRRDQHLSRPGALASVATRVKVNGLRWVCFMLLVPIPWAARVWLGLLATVDADDFCAIALRSRCRENPSCPVPCLTIWPICSATRPELDTV